ncbi:MAG: hypothetical protein HY316_03120 [Acidobacteria bacterium]|nr:hypothetical protein [Acidobacteriota bacterium]
MKLLSRALPLLSLLVFALCVPSRSAAQETLDHAHMDHRAAPAPGHVKSAAELEADKRFSEFNHRFAGVFVLLVGLLAMFEPGLAKRYKWMRFLWSVLFFAPGVYLIIWSDPESWPTGNQTLAYVVTQNMQVLQHKVFSLILLGLVVVEFIRVRRKLPSVWLSSIFPVLAGLGALLLLFHPHASDVGMGAEEHLAMLKIQHQHLGFAATGFGIAVSKAFADMGRFHPRLMRNLFAVLMVVLALLLLFYTE